MANENSKTPTQAQPQMIPLSKIHELPGVFNPKPQDKSLGSMVLSIESSGVKESVILRQRDDGEYQLLSGYRRRRASELAKKQDIPAHVYEMTMQEAIANSKVVESKIDNSITAVRIFRSLTLVKMYFHIIFKIYLLSIGGGILQCVLDCFQYGITGKRSTGYRIDL